MKTIHTILKRTALAAIVPIVGLASLSAHAQTTTLRAQTGAPGSSTFTFVTAVQTLLQKHLPLQINVTSGQAATRSTLDAARGNTDLFTSAPSINQYMGKGTNMFKDMKGAPELFNNNVRGILNHPLGPYHIITYADSGIKELKDIKGKKLFIGPPGGAATVVGLAIIEGTTGYKPGVDYEQAKLDWTSGGQAFQDRQVDLAIIPTLMPSPQISQYALLDKIRMIGIPDEAFKTEPMKKILSIPGRTISEIPADAYGPNQVNTEAVKAVGSWVGLSTRIGMSEDQIYQITKAIFENIKEIHDTAPFLKLFTLDSALNEMNGYLHVGALKYYREIGVKVDPALIPPEAK
ncbi:MAG: TAXI family TRAP transporter solute-binding subunit [Burkholderiaceae bacterium]